MSNREKISWCAGVLLLVALYLLSSTDLIIKEKKREICRISVIIDNVNDNYYGSFRAGMDIRRMSISSRCTRKTMRNSRKN